MNRNLSPDEFSQQFLPSEYGPTWEDVEGAMDEDEGDEEFHSRAWIDRLTPDVQEHGVREPVQVFRGHVVDGHHRVVAARRADQSIPYEEAPSELYEGQLG